MKTQLDHVVVLAKTLEQGVQWCEATLGITPAPGGEHAQYGTHNRLFKIATPTNPFAYLEIIAIDPQAKGPAQGKRWFDMDDPAVQAAVTTEPRLIHLVANTSDLHAARIALKGQGVDPGPAVHAKRHARKGVLHWQITVRDDGQRLFNGAMPTLIQWGKADDADPMRLHPRNSLPRSGVSLQSVAINHPSADKLQAAYAAIGLEGIALQTGAANITVELRTPKGMVSLQSLGI
ncbi:VOC family protein [Rhodoferax lacus]|uniref:VOC family protein n=1 Tax=Rhodoferax lacus TaxID=2184758 RepID=A0A3E1R921_9BURK|nr:VOC family protein [Rhodoferax lacus]RFO95869.1 VOC family protein [Rhodoferax lacus]